MTKTINQLRQEIRAGVREYQTENLLDEKSRYLFRRDWFDLEDNVLPKQEWKEFLNFHAEKVYGSPHYEVIPFPGMGLGLLNTNWMRVNDLAPEVPGYLEYIDDTKYKRFLLVNHLDLSQ